MSANLPADFNDFLRRIRELEGMDVTSSPAYPVAAPVAQASYFPMPPPVQPVITASARVGPDVMGILDVFQNKLVADLTARFRAMGASGYRHPTGPSSGAGRGRGVRSGPDTRTCYACGRTGNIARDCPSRKI